MYPGILPQLPVCWTAVSTPDGKVRRNGHGAPPPFLVTNAHPPHPLPLPLPTPLQTYYSNSSTGQTSWTVPV